MTRSRVFNSMASRSAWKKCQWATLERIMFFYALPWKEKTFPLKKSSPLLIPFECCWWSLRIFYRSFDGFFEELRIFFGIQEIFHALNSKVHLKSCSLNKSAQSALEINIIKFLHRQPPLSSTNKPQHRCLFRGIRIKNASICKNLKIYRIKESLRGLSKPFSQK